ncbi:addiction module toxin RelE [Lacticaseibacillus zeae]|uniref:Addiction module toxin RelE n=1 Tax=Lacticaseibacillus zeae TaxID=57037 RepID=A0A5R8LV70_LACZE|nr:addiction module toxin RelE [Lacticaseibacillus zeae]TLF41136.1 addiction module toxin RelE [Lacticaseibacillus zeae]
MTVNNYHLNFYPEAQAEYDKLDGSQRIFVDKALIRLRTFGMNAGQALHGKLTGFRKLKNKKTGLRIVFGQSLEGITIMDIVAVGYREDLQVYRNSEKRVQQRKEEI